MRLHTPFQFLSGLAGITLALLVLGTPAAHAQLVFTLSPSTLTTTPGSTVTYQAILQNQSTTDTYYLNDLNYTFSEGGSVATVDATSFLSYVPASLAPGTSYGSPSGGNFVDVLVDQAATPETVITGTFTVLGGTTSTATTPVGSQGFTLKIASVAVPEAPTGLLAGLGVLLLPLYPIVRRQRLAAVASRTDRSCM